jgi:hypothetical protein
MRYDVVLQAASAAVLPPDYVLHLRAGPRSTVPIDSISYFTDYDEGVPGDLLCHVRGRADDMEAATRELGNSGLRNLQLLATAANAAIMRPYATTVYQPELGGAFRASRVFGEDPQTARRTLDPAAAGALIEAVDAQSNTDRLVRACENYGESLRQIFPESLIHAANHLWITAGPYPSHC